MLLVCHLWRIEGRRRMHSIVEDFLASPDGSLLAVIDKYAGSDDPLITALVSLCKATQGTYPAEEAMRIAAGAIGTDPHDPELELLFFGNWALLCHVKRHFSEVPILVRLAGQHLHDGTPAILRAFVTILEGLAANAAGRHGEYEEKLDGALAVVPPDSPFFGRWCRLKIAWLSHFGRLAEIRSDPRYARLVDAMEANPRTCPSGFVDAIETGDIERASELAARIEPHRNALLEVDRNNFDAGRKLLALMSRTLGRGGSVAELSDENVYDASFASTLCLVRRAPDRALAFAREFAAKFPEFAATLGFGSYLLLRAELACGNAEAAERLMPRFDRRSYYVDDFFRARLAALNGDLPAARDYMQNALTAAARYGARNRLDFEARLACELSPLAFLKLPVKRAPSAGRETRRTDYAAKPGTGEYTIIGNSARMRRLRAEIARLAVADVPVLFRGATGTGKELAARLLHDLSGRKNEPFLAINCGAIPDALLESELFGYRRGAFTGAHEKYPGLFREAAGGTLFLDEIGDISPRLQLTLLRVLETGEVRSIGSPTTDKIACRIVAATNADLEAGCRDGSFRRDLFYRLNRISLRLPTLAERREDIPELAEHFLRAGRIRNETVTMSPELADALTAGDWPGNVRELKNEIERMRLMNSDKTSYGLADLALQFRPAANAVATPNPTPRPVGPPDTHGDFPFSKTRETRIAELRSLFEKYGKLRRSEIARYFKISPQTVTNDLKILCAEELIEKIAPTAAPRTHYFVVKKGAAPN